MNCVSLLKKSLASFAVITSLHNHIIDWQCTGLTGVGRGREEVSRCTKTTSIQEMMY